MGARATRPAARPTSTTSTTRCSGTARSSRSCAASATSMTGAGLRRVGQGRVQPRSARDRLQLRATPSTTCDNHVLYKTGAKEIAAHQGMSLTFMAKYDEREGNSCHIHLCLRPRRRAGAAPATTRDGILAADGALPRRPAGLPARSSRCFFAPNVNSYKRFVAGSFAPTAIAWGRDNRTCALRVVGHGDVAALREPRARRRRQPVPRRRGDDRRRPARHRERAGAGARLRGQRLRPRTSRTCRARCATPSRCSTAARSPGTAFGDDVVDHYVNAAPRRARRLRRGRHRLGARPWLRAPLRRSPGRASASRPTWSRPAGGRGTSPPSLLPHAYVAAVHRAGGVPVLLPPLPDGAAEALAGVHGLLRGRRCGRRRGALRGRAARGQRPAAARPRRLGAGAARRGAGARVPVLGVCRGAQVLNVATGGSLHQHLPDVVGRRSTGPRPPSTVACRSRSSPAARWPAAVGQAVDVPCYHHQAIDRLGAGLRATALGRGRDGRGGRAPRPALRPRRAVAPRAGRPRRPAVRRPRAGGPAALVPPPQEIPS